VTAGRAPDWLAELQRSFGAVLRTELDRSSGVLRARPARYDAAACRAVRPSPGRGAAERLAVYNRQYWFRLFGALQAEYRLTTALMGPWALNGFASDFLATEPPRGHDLARAADGFAAYLEAAIPAGGVAPAPGAPEVPRGALLQAAAIDEAFRAVIGAPSQPPFRPAADDAARLPQSRLVPSAAVALVDEDWALVALHRTLGPSPPKTPLPARHARTQAHAICRADAGHRVVPLAPTQARLLRLLRDHPVAEALAIVETEAASDERPLLAKEVQRWLAESVKLGFWTGLQP
jgi:hypothetical protein